MSANATPPSGLTGPPGIVTVQAAAGSGKTYRLTAQFLALIRTALKEEGRACLPARPEKPGGPGGHCWPEILAVTFTNKAAAEMKERVIRCLKDRALGGAGGPAADWTPEEAAAWLDVLIRRYQGLNIRTIDSLLFQLIGCHALELGVPAEFEPAFDTEALMRQAYEDLMARAAAGEPEASVLVAEAVDALLAMDKRKGFAPKEQLFEETMRLARAAWDALLGPAEAQRAAAHAPVLLDDLRRAATGLETALGNGGLAADKRFTTFLTHCLPGGDPGKAIASTYGRKTAVAEVLLKRSPPATDRAERAYAALKAALSAYAPVAGAAHTAPLLALAGRCASGMAAALRRDGRIPIRFWPDLVKALFEPEGPGDTPDDRTDYLEAGAAGAVLCRLGNRLSHLLIDEFQDTSRGQWEALRPLVAECLSRGGALFYVGDVKQAIYGWRGGDARLFAEAAAEPELTALAAPVAERLGHNWRSSRAVVDLNNQVFSRLEREARAVAEAVLAKEPEERHVAAVSRALEEAFSGAAQQHPPGQDPPEGYVRLERIQAESAAELEERIESRFKETLTALLERRPPGDLAVLVRTGAQAAAVADWCLDLGAPVVAEGSLLLAEHHVIRALVAFLRWLEDPRDDLALYEALRLLPPQALDGEALADWAVAARTGNGGDGRPLGRALAEDHPELHARYLAPFAKRAGLMQVYDLAQECFEFFRIFDRYPDDEVFLLRFLELAHAAEARGLGAPSAFLAYWDREGAEEKAPLPESLDAVRVMTIHKAKGLEFPVVIAPFHHFAPRLADNLVPVTVGPGRTLVRLSSRLADYGERAAPLLVEQMALLYVLWTRPREELYAFITSSKHGRGTVIESLEVLLAPLGLAEDGDVYEAGTPATRALRPPAPASGPPCGLPSGARPKPMSEPASEPSSEPSTERPMAWLPRLKIFRSTPALPLFDEKTRGTAAHRLLELWRPGKDLERALTRTLMECRPAPPDPEALAAELRAMAAWLEGLPELAPVFGARTLQAEAAFLDGQGGRRKADLLALTGAGPVVLEYKTGRPDQETRDAYRRQVRRYLDLVRAVYGPAAGGVRGCLVYLDERRLDWQEGPDKDPVHGGEGAS